MPYKHKRYRRRTAFDKNVKRFRFTLCFKIEYDAFCFHSPLKRVLMKFWTVLDLNVAIECGLDFAFRCFIARIIT